MIDYQIALRIRTPTPFVENVSFLYRASRHAKGIGQPLAPDTLRTYQYVLRLSLNYPTTTYQS